jgi:hypothetical protein
MHGDDENGQVRVQGEGVLDQFQAIPSRHRNVHRKKVRLELLQFPQGVLGVRGGRGTTHVWLTVNELLQSFAQHGVVIHHGDVLLFRVIWSTHDFDGVSGLQEE